MPPALQAGTSLATPNVVLDGHSVALGCATLAFSRAEASLNGERGPECGSRSAAIIFTLAF